MKNICIISNTWNVKTCHTAILHWILSDSELPFKLVTLNILMTGLLSHYFWTNSWLITFNSAHIANMDLVVSLANLYSAICLIYVFFVFFLKSEFIHAPDSSNFTSKGSRYHFLPPCSLLCSILLLWENYFQYRLPVFRSHRHLFSIFTNVTQSLYSLAFFLYMVHTIVSVYEIL